MKNALATLALAAMALAPQVRAATFDQMHAEYLAWKYDPFIARVAHFPNQAGIFLVGKNFGKDAARIQVQFNGQHAAGFILHNPYLIEATAPNGLQGNVQVRVLRDNRPSQDEVVHGVISANASDLLSSGYPSDMIWRMEAIDRDSGSRIEANYTVGMLNGFVKAAFGLP